MINLFLVIPKSTLLLDKKQVLYGRIIRNEDSIKTEMPIQF